MIEAIAPVLDRIASIESRFAAPQIPPVAGAAAPSDLAFAGVMAEYTGAPERPPLAMPELTATPLTADSAPAAVPGLGCPCGCGGSVGAFASATGVEPAGAVSGVPYADHFTAAGLRHGVPADLLAAVGWVESRYQPNAVSPAGAEGLMQLMPFVSEELGVDPYDPAAAIDGAARLLAGHYRRFGSWDLAIAAYHAGAGAVARAGGVPSPRTATYVQRVVERMGGVL